MLFIVVHHLLVHAAIPNWNDTSVYNSGIAWNSILNGFLYVHVNCFVLISGYFGIRFRWKKLWQIYLLCAFYGFVIYWVHFVVDDVQSVGKTLVYNTIFCLSHNNLWFIKSYVGLLLLSPVLNAAVENLQKKQYIGVLGLLTIMNVYFGWFWHVDVINNHGYNLVQFIYIYVIGRYIALHVDWQAIKNNRWKSLMVYVACALLWGGIMVFMHKVVRIPHMNLWTYNNPLTLIGAIALLLFALSFSFQNKVVNYLSASVLSVYVIHEGAYMCGYIYGFATEQFAAIQQQYGTNIMILVVCLSAMGLMGACLLVDQIRRLLFYWVGKACNALDAIRLMRQS